MIEAADTWRKRMDRDTMLFEDDQSYLVGIYLDAQERKRDYDRYFVLATRYGHYSEKGESHTVMFRSLMILNGNDFFNAIEHIVEFYKDAYPGFRYWKKAVLAAYNFQRLWDRYWSVTKIRRFRGARFLQNLWRKYFAKKTYGPIIKMRLKMGKR